MVSHKSTKEIFAIKSFARYHVRQFKSVKRALENEVSIMERLSAHKHMIQVYGTFISGAELGIVLSPAASHGDLAVYITKALESGITHEQRDVLNRAFGCLASGLSHIHSHTIRHKDIKPQNILIHHGRVIYTDFGISFDADQQDTTTVGPPEAYTPRYCAPEVKDWANRNRKSDVYSLGCVFVEMLDVLEPEIGLRSKDSLPYHRKIEEIRHCLLCADVDTGAKKELFQVCRDMLHPDQVERIDTAAVLRRMATLSRSSSDIGANHFCNDCLKEHKIEDSVVENHLADDVVLLSVEEAPMTESEISRSDTVNSTQPITNTKKRKPKSKATSHVANQFLGSTNSRGSRYYCNKCGELGHKPGRCPNECWACGELYHKSFECPNKCYTCDEAGHFARDCPNECDACGEIGHPTDECPNRCETCGDVGHIARNCPDECFICGKRGHETMKCKGKCHRCGKLGHWSRDCNENCYECKSLVLILCASYGAKLRRRETRALGCAVSYKANEKQEGG